MKTVLTLILCTSLMCGCTGTHVASDQQTAQTIQTDQNRGSVKETNETVERSLESNPRLIQSDPTSANDVVTESKNVD